MKIQVILGSTRQGRVTERVAKWAMAEAGKVPDFELELVDLADYPMPFMDEAVSPRYNPDRKPAPEVAKWLTKVAEADGYIMVSPEYNRSMPAVLKNAIDYLDYQVDRKPVGLVTHGTLGGAEAAANIRLALRGVGTISVPQAVAVPNAKDLPEDGILSEEAAKAFVVSYSMGEMLKNLVWWTKTLKAGRDQA